MKKRIVMVGVLIIIMAVALPIWLSDSDNESAADDLGSNQPVERSDEKSTLTPPANKRW